METDDVSRSSSVTLFLQPKGNYCQHPETKGKKSREGLAEALRADSTARQQVLDEGSENQMKTWKTWVWQSLHILYEGPWLYFYVFNWQSYPGNDGITLKSLF